jgi:ABC-type transport system involved in multi-copper enzyme maturation permease subunit
MSWQRLYTVLKADFLHNLKRPLFWIWFALLGWNAWLISNSSWIIRSVDTSVGTEKSFVNSEFQLAFVFSLMCFLMLGLFVAIIAGTPILRDSQYRVGEIIHATPLRPSEYIWGKYLAALATCLVAILLFVLTVILLTDVIPNPAAAEFHGPFKMRNYLMPALVFMMPAIFFITSISLAISVYTRRAFLVYLFPVGMLVLVMNFLYRWYPSDPTASYLMQCADPSGFRWLKQTWLLVDRGVSFYNTHPIHYDPGFLLGRFFYVVLAIGFVVLSVNRFAKRFARIPDRRVKAIQQSASAIGTAAYLPPKVLPDVSRKLSGIAKQIIGVIRFELKELISQPWLLVVIAIIAIVLLMPDRGARGELHVLTRYTSGLMAVNTFTPLTMMLCFFLMFTTADSLHRETTTGLSPLYFSTPAHTTAIVVGKTLANFAIAIISMAVCFIFVSTFLIQKNEAPFQFAPFLYTWIYLMLPTFLFWCAFIAAAYSITRSRTASYALGIALLFISGWAVFNQKVNWLTHWSLVESLVWTDFGVFELDRKALILNRLFYFSITIVLLIVAVWKFPRRNLDPHRHSRLSKSAARLILKTAAILAIPVALGITLWMAVENGFQGTSATNAQKDYWRRNVATFWNAPLPDRTFINIDMRLEPRQRSFHMNGSYEMINNQTIPLYRIPLTGVGYWSNLKWTVNGKAHKPENRSGMFVFNFDPPLQPKQKVTIGFSYDGVMLPGVSRSGGYLDLGEFLLESGTALTGRNPWFVPVLGFVETIGVDEKNRYEPRDPGPKYYEGITEAGIDRSLLNTRIRLDVPEDYIATSMGVLKNQEVKNGRRILLWESDYPLRVFNVVAGRWTYKDGKTSRIYYLPAHPYNVDSMLSGLDGARKYYSEWFGPYVWRDLRMNEFPALALYARGNPTNIFFSEGIGFLTKDHMETDIFFGLSAFAITAHESAHQWWGHMLAPGNGPGGIILAEGMANFATLCLLEQMKGDKDRQAAAQFMEQNYGEGRFVTSERPLSQTSNFRPADTTVIYDKGGWVFWMLRNLMGRDAMYAGLRSFITKFHRGPDHPVIEDFVAHMGSYAPDPAAYDAFVKQWFFEVKMPEYHFLEKPQKRAIQNRWDVHARIKNVGNTTMPVEVAAIKGDRFKDGDKFRKSSISITIGANETKDVMIHCNFEPERLVVDPDVQVFQLQRNAATARF